MKNIASVLLDTGDGDTASQQRRTVCSFVQYVTGVVSGVWTSHRSVQRVNFHIIILLLIITVSNLI
jgi:hypothetical protein